MKHGTEIPMIGLDGKGKSRRKTFDSAGGVHKPKVEGGGHD